MPHKVVVQLTDGTTNVNGSSIQLGVDGSTTPAAVVSKIGTVTTATLNLLNQPLTAQTAAPPAVTDLTRRLEDYLRTHTEILME